MRRRTVDLIAATAFLAGVAVMTWESYADTYLETGQGVAHDAVFYPRILLGVIALLAIMLGVSALARHSSADAPIAAMRWRVAAALVVATSLYVVMMPLFGFLATTIVFVAVVPVLLGFRRWIMLAIVIALFPLVSWWLFVSFIGIPLPGVAVY
jgi:putative tricarboxylic transport membrane protein